MSGLSTQQHWILQPLTDAGLADHQVSTLLFRLAFDTAVEPAGSTALDLHALADDQPVHVRRAWLEVLDRMTTGPAGGRGAPETRGSRNEEARGGAFPASAGG